MEPDVLLLEHGEAIGWAALVLVLGTPVAILALAHAIRTAHAIAALGPRLRGARRGVRGARSGERVWVLGTLESSGDPVPGIDGAPSAISRVETDGEVVRRRAEGLRVRTALAHTPVSGPIDLDASTRHAIRTEYVLLEPATLRHVETGDTVAVVGRAVAIAAPQGTSYRASAHALAVGPDADGLVHAAGLGRPRVTARRIAAIGGVLGAIGAVVTLGVAPAWSLGAPSLRWTVPEHDDHLPFRLWIPLASPARATALDHASRWIEERLADPYAPGRVIRLGVAAREIVPSCALDASLVRHRPDLFTTFDPACEQLATAAARIVVHREINVWERLEAPIAAWIRDQHAVPVSAWIEPALDDDARLLGPLARVGDPEIGWQLILLTATSDDLPDDVRELRTAWIHDLALIEAARPREEIALRMLAAARRLDPDHPDHDAIARALALRAMSAEHDADPIEGAPRAPEVSERVRTAFEEHGDWHSHDAWVTASLRAAAAHDELGSRADAIRFADAGSPSWMASRPARDLALRALGIRQGSAQVPW